MPKKVWTGGIFIREEGGYNIILKSLEHYKRRLKTLGNSPEMKDSAAMFASVLNQQARKTVPEIDEKEEKVKEALQSPQAAIQLSEDVPFLEKALMCYQSDIHKAQETGHEYFVNLIGDSTNVQGVLDSIDIALQKIKEFSE